MSRLVRRVGFVGLVAALVGSQGCVVPWAKYQNLKKRYEQLASEVESKDRQIQDDQVKIAGLEGRIDDLGKIVKLYEDKKQAAEQLAAETEAKLAEYQKKLDEFAKRWRGQVEAGPGMIAIADKLLFALGSADISQEGQKALQELAAEFKDADVILQIDGHTDDRRVVKRETVEKFTDNLGLSAARAAAVCRLLAKNGMPEKYMYIRGFSMHKPRVPNTSDDNRARNRRVEVMFFPREAVEAPKAQP